MGLTMTREKTASDRLDEQVYKSRNTPVQCLVFTPKGVLTIDKMSFTQVLDCLGGGNFMERKFFKIEESNQGPYALTSTHITRYVVMHFCYNIDLEANQYGSSWVEREVTGHLFIMAVTVNMKNQSKFFSSLTASDLITSGTRQLILESLNVDPAEMFTQEKKVNYTASAVVIPPPSLLMKVKDFDLVEDEDENFDAEAEILDDLDVDMLGSLEDLDVTNKVFSDFTARLPTLPVTLETSRLYVCNLCDKSCISPQYLEVHINKCRRANTPAIVV